MIIKDIRLLTLEEFSKYKTIIPHIDISWWLQTSSVWLDDAYIVINKLGFSTTDKTNLQGVRPVLIVEDLIAFPEDKINLFDSTWTVLDGDPNNTILLCDGIIDTHYYDNKSQNWFNSEIKDYLESRLYYSIEASEIIVMYETKTEFLLLQSLCKKYNLNKLNDTLCINTGCLMYSPYKDWQLTPANTHNKPLLSFEEFCEYITKENTI